MQHLIHFFDRYVRGAREAIRYDDGLRRWSYTYDQVHEAAESYAQRLTQAGLKHGDRLMIWCDNRPEWVVVFWACILRGVTAVPVDARASADLVRRVVTAATARAIVASDGADLTGVSLPVVWRTSDIEWPPASRPRAGAPGPRPPVTPDTVAEILFTSGTTGEPKGVLITHGNIVANILPLERVAQRYQRHVALLRPLRFLALVPLSHMFGQAVSLFAPPLVSATTVFVRGYAPGDVVRQVRRHRVTLLMTVPRMLEQLRAYVRRERPACAEPLALQSLAARVWRHRDVHRLFGWKCLGFVVGGAYLETDVEEFWRRLGFAVIQGYGLTETAPIVAWNNPFRIRHGTVGAPLEGMEVRIAPDGEVLVRGAAVSPGYLNAPEEERAVLDKGWLHTGDIGELDEAGHLRIRGRKKDVIVTAEGVNVFPEDLEPQIEQQAGVREAAVVGRTNGGERVHAVLVLEPGTDAAAVIRSVNARLEPHQRIRDFSVWPGAALPRTGATGKLKRAEIRQWLAGGSIAPAAASPTRSAVEQVVAELAPHQRVTPQTTLDELGLTSLDRIELMMALEERAGVTLGEAAVADARTIADLDRAVREAVEAAPADAIVFPRWARRRGVVAVRTISLTTWILPLARLFMALRVDGREHLEGLTGPVIFAANHQSHFDTPALLSALPRRWRSGVSVAMARDFFDAYFKPAGHSLRERVLFGALYYLAVVFFHAFPLPRTGPGARDALRYAGDLVTDGFSILLFPEGQRTERGEINLFQPGVAMMAARLHVPVVPVRLEGLDRVLHHTWRWPRRGPVRVSFGAPLRLEGDDYPRLARTVEEAVRALGSGSDTARTSTAA